MIKAIISAGEGFNQFNGSLMVRSHLPTAYAGNNLHINL